MPLTIRNILHPRRRPQISPTFFHPAAPRRPDGEVAWFTYEHNAHLERLLGFPPGAVLQLYQTHLAAAAQRILGENGDVSPPPYEGSAEDAAVRLAVLEVGREGERERQRRGNREGERENQRRVGQSSEERRERERRQQLREDRRQQEGQGGNGADGGFLRSILRRRQGGAPAAPAAAAAALHQAPAPRNRVTLSLGGEGRGPVVMQGRVSPRTSPTMRSGLRTSSTSKSASRTSPTTRSDPRTSPTSRPSPRFPTGVPPRKPVPTRATQSSGNGLANRGAGIMLTRRERILSTRSDEGSVSTRTRSNVRQRTTSDGDHSGGHPYDYPSLWWNGI